ncbi:EAL domain-containing protein [Novosphingobium sp. 1949]|uniref:EAL domain-containing protein n=1 Tax=Novosphingobium organovorum TaxID=2930092 RepID=A0ABT0B8A2_9SPHN|nr:EAL domain-containing protein [Novosphingobium organovorum]MCJ2181301.1 EAL domain-containing protein [Novosphingobium organovorum]
MDAKVTSTTQSNSKPGNAKLANCEATGQRPVDVVALGIVTAAILLFVATGSAVAPQIVRSFMGRGPGPDHFILNAFLLNIAIIIFGWSRYRQLNAELEQSNRDQAEARRLAETDPLTGFLNRRSFHARADQMLAEAPAQGRAVTVMMIDLDNFKQVNDFNGHAAGDQLLRQCAARIREVVPAGSAIGRIGGDEFVIAISFLPGQTAHLTRLAEVLLKQIARTLRIGETTVEITASVGLAASLPQAENAPAPTARALLEYADVAMYHAKHQGRNAFAWFEPQMAEELHLRTELEDKIRKGVKAGEFIPYYERQIELASGRLTGFEMLARWQSPELGIVSPDIFIPIAEDIGAIAELSENVIRQALEDAKGWPRELTLAVNISPLQLRDPWFAQKLLKLLLEANFPPDRLEIEITESCLHHNVGQVRSLLTSLKNQGIKVSLDDFGTGYSSLAQLRSLPFDRMKIDRSFVERVHDDQDSAAIVRAIAMLGEGLHLPITAEGIANADILGELLKVGDLKGQGYYYGKPRPAGELAEWLAETVAQAAPCQGVSGRLAPAGAPSLERPLAERTKSDHEGDHEGGDESASTRKSHHG